MIERLVVQNFKSFRKAELDFGRFNILLGSNGSGKSNLIDALKVLWGLGSGIELKPLFAGTGVSVGGNPWPGIRGGLGYALYQGTDASQEPCRLAVRIRAENIGNRTPGAFRQGMIEYEVGFDSQGDVTSEKLVANNRKAFEFSGLQANFYLPNGDVVPMSPNPSFGSQLVLGMRMGVAGENHQYREEMLGILAAWQENITRTQFLELEGRVLRDYGKADGPKRLGPAGEDFSAVVAGICEDPDEKEAYLKWLQELRPGEVEDVIVKRGAVQDPLLFLRERGLEWPATVLSDGTLRFAAMCAAFFQKNVPALISFEEIENGIHASGLRVLMEMLAGLAEARKTQIIATTHSPTAVNWLTQEQLRTTFLFARQQTTGESRVSPLTEVPHFGAATTNYPAGDLLIERWLEAEAS